MNSLFVLIPSVIILLALIYAGFIVIRKFPLMSNINVDTIPEEKEMLVKKKILIDRLSRKTSDKMQKMTSMFDALWRFSQKRFRVWYQKAVDMDRKYRRKYRPILDEKNLSHTTENLLDQADDQFDMENLASAEKRFIEVLALDPHNYKAYKGLACIYAQKKEHKQAKEVLLYMVKLNIREQKKISINDGVTQDSFVLLQEELAEVYYDLGVIAEYENDLQLAFDYFNESVRLRSQNPKYLDALLDAAISCGKKAVAIEVFCVLKKVNADNKKLDEFCERIKVMNV